MQKLCIVLACYSLVVTVLLVISFVLIGRARSRMKAFVQDWQIKRAYAQKILQDKIDSKSTVDLLKYLHDLSGNSGTSGKTS